MFHFIPFPTLNINRLILRKPEFSDAAELSLLRSDPAVNKYIDRPPHLSEADAGKLLEKFLGGIDRNEWIFWIITFQEKFAGTICIWNISEEKQSGELGYELFPEFQGKGIMQEAFAAVLNYGFDVIGLKSLEAWTHKDNLASRKLLERNQFQKDLEVVPQKTETEDQANLVVYRLSLTP